MSAKPILRTALIAQALLLASCGKSGKDAAPSEWSKICAQAAAGDIVPSASNGSLECEGKKVPVIAVYAADDAGRYDIVVSDRADAVKHAQNASFTSVGHIHADQIARELTKQGAHPFTVEIPKVAEPDISIRWGSQVGAPSSILEDVELKMNRADDERVDGSLDYDGNEFKLRLPFALALHEFGNATKVEEPPKLPEPTEPKMVLYLSVSLLKYEAEQYWKAHDHIWPTSVDQPGFADGSLVDRLAHLPAKMRKVSLGANGVITATFAPDLPRLGDQTVVLTPTYNNGGYFDWKCVGIPAKDLPDFCTP